MKKLIQIILLFPLACFAQSSHYTDFNYDIMRIKTTEIDEKVMGSPYVNEELAYGVIIHNQDTLSTKGMRYNGYNDEIEFNYGMSTESSSLIKQIGLDAIIGSEHYVFSEFKDTKTNKGYFILLYTGGKYSLFKRVEIKIRSGRIAKSSLEKTIQPRFIKKVNYYFKTNKQNTLLVLGSTYKKVISNLPPKETNKVKSMKSKLKKINDEKLIDLFIKLNCKN